MRLHTCWHQRNKKREKKPCCSRSRRRNYCWKYKNNNNDNGARCTSSKLQFIVGSGIVFSILILVIRFFFFWLLISSSSSNFFCFFSAHFLCFCSFFLFNFILLDGTSFIITSHVIVTSAPIIVFSNTATKLFLYDIKHTVYTVYITIPGVILQVLHMLLLQHIDTYRTDNDNVYSFRLCVWCRKYGKTIKFNKRMCACICKTKQLFPILEFPLLKPAKTVTFPIILLSFFCLSPKLLHLCYSIT